MAFEIIDLLRILVPLLGGSRNCGLVYAAGATADRPPA